MRTYFSNTLMHFLLLFSNYHVSVLDCRCKYINSASNAYLRLRLDRDINWEALPSVVRPLQTDEEMEAVE